MKEGVSLSCNKFISGGIWGAGVGGTASAPSPLFLWGAQPSPHFCKIINNFFYLTTVNSLGLKNTILENSSNRRLVCLKQETTYVADWIETFHSFIRTPSLPPPRTLLRKAILCSFVVGTIEDCILQIRRVQNVVGVLKKRQRPPFIASWGVGERWLWAQKNGMSNFIFNPPLLISLHCS